MGVLYFYIFDSTGGGLPLTILFESVFSEIHYHLYTAVKASDIDNLSCSDTHTAAGTDIFACTAGFLREDNPCGTAVGACASDLKTGKLIAVYQNVGQIII